MPVSGPDREGSAQDEPPSRRWPDPASLGSPAGSHSPSPWLMDHRGADSPGLAHVPSRLQQNAKRSSRGFDLKLSPLLLARIHWHHTLRRLRSIYSVNICLKEILIIMIFHNEKNKKRIIKSYHVTNFYFLCMYLWIVLVTVQYLLNT